MRHETPAAPPLTAETVDYLMTTRGWVLFPGQIGEVQLQALRDDSETVYARRRALQLKNGVGANMEGAAHHVLGEDTSFDAFIADPPLWETIEGHFAGKFILLNFGATLLQPGADGYTLKPHRDVRAYSRDYRLSLNMLVMLDDFTVENGATLVLSGSHQVEAMPSLELFHQYAEPVTGKAGDILLFDSLLVHSAAPNRSAAQRRALTLCFGRPFFKPQMDWPRYLGPDQGLSPKARQLLGYDARSPESLEEYYQPPERWTFKPDQR
ncbi:ectoine hydroxylase-related dioxygenase (phytanoyl-CoA dioxygenase family) [Caulobacter ginsengisoli]|uniref:Ectoine hydroxylase-related dioxygenase (Phytanoyl-CoA dioxygenase family) n=1 Tax=Caulobacter ginsengisoli TaxID=400775 RepID=A0ABU0IRH4_9CAUL|nr:phytanoyl-CoA dioxygenase family protein [Caulobacter ginsengisoli]MDQ0464616.1 ectoine hydroxylase-related dioxygenase (phytanoyl-CoA dioxygenase family) [Caulobacter ginsengisoli]